MYAAELARQLGRIDGARVAEHRRVVAAYDLPMNLPPDADPDELVVLMGRDKKAIDGLTFVLDGPGGVEPVTGLERADLDAPSRRSDECARRLGHQRSEPEPAR